MLICRLRTQSLNLHFPPCRFFFQGVHMLLSFGSSANGSVAPWAPNEPRTNKLIFIGRNLDADQLKRNFQQCIIA